MEVLGLTTFRGVESNPETSKPRNPETLTPLIGGQGIREVFGVGREKISHARNITYN